MSAADYSYGEAADVSDRLMYENDVTLADVVGALANAMRRIAFLESKIEQLQAAREVNP